MSRTRTPRLAALPALAACQQSAPAQPPLAGAAIGEEFTLTGENGEDVSWSDFDGQYRIVYFGYAYCPDVCPTDVQRMAQGLNLFERQSPELARQIQPIFITVDPARDRPQALKDYVSHFHPRLIGLTGAESEIRAVAKAYRIHRRKVVLADSAGPDDYLVDHASITHLMGPDGKHVTLFPHGTDAERMAEVLRRYLP